MKKSVQKTNSTQKFIEISDVYEDIVILTNGNACIIIEVEATNFDLLSADEQDGKIYSYSALLNSLSFPIQIVVRSKLVNISNYLESLDFEAKKTQNPALNKHILLYKDFVAELIKINTVLDKKFYIVASYSALEKGVFGAKQTTEKNTTEAFSLQARSALHSKAEAIHAQLRRINLKAETLSKDKIIKLFYDIFNDGIMDTVHLTEHIKSGLVKGKEKK